MLKFFLLFSSLLTIHFSFSQSVYITSSGGSFPTEKWMNITTGPNGTGTLVWEQSTIAVLCGTTNGGLVADVAIDLSAHCGATLYINTYDRWADSWDGTLYEIWTGAGQTGSLLANNGGVSPTNGLDTDASSDFCDNLAEELETSEAFTVPVCPCTFPIASYTVLPADCGIGQFSIQIDVTSTGDATGVDISDGTVTFETDVNNGTYVVGPFTAGINKIINVEGTNYGGCDINSAILTETCACSNAPVASINGTSLDCIGLDYSIEVTVNNFGDGTTADIWIDGGLIQSNAVLSNLYTFTGYVVGSHSVEIKSTGGAFVTCETSYSVSMTCNGSELCSGAPDITNTCQSGDLTTATVDGGALIENYISCGNGNTIALCGANSGFTGGSYSRTDHADIWYKVYPNGSNQVTITISNLAGGNLMVLPYLTNGTCPSSLGDNTTLEGHIGNSGITGASCPYFSADGSLVLSGADVATATVIYLRIMAYANNGSGATNCETLTYPTFDICTTVPQANDLCTDAIDIVDPTTFLPITASGDISQSSIDADSHDGVDTETCNGINFTTSEEDLWYGVETPSTGNYFLNVDIIYTGTVGPMYVLLHNYCEAGDSDPIGCMEISASGTVVFDATNITNFDNALTAGNEYKIRIVKPTGSVATSFEITGGLIAENNNCELMQQTFPGFDLDAGPIDANFNFATESGAVPTQVGNDLWYQFDPIAGSDNGNPVYSSSVDLQVGGLAVGQELTVMIYKRTGASSCTSLASDYVYTQTVNSNVTVVINCLDELHGTSATGDGYILRVIQTAGAIVDNVQLQVFPNPEGPFNNDCENIWNGSGPAIVGGGNALNNFNPWFIPAGASNFVVDDFENATDCHPSINSSDCGGNDLTHDRDLWFVFEVPSNDCSTTGLTASTGINSIDITYNSGSSFRDAYAFIYDGCSDADLIDCSGSLDGAGETWTVDGLTQGQFYLLRLKPASLNTDDEYSFDITVEEGAKRPCNDDGASAEPMPVNSCNDYGSLATWSMQGASQSSGAGVLENDVWFSFDAPSPANGGPYFVANKSWVTVFFENVAGTSTGPLSLQLYNSPSSIVATATTYSTTTAVGSQSFAQFGHLNPGQTYYLRLYSKENETAQVQYRLNVYTPNANETAWSCGMNTESLTTGCSEGCNDLREAYFKIDLPEGTPSDEYYMIEVVGEDQLLDFELRSQFISESSATEGDFDDYDLPCSSRPLDPGVSIVSEVLGITSPTTGESCNTNGNTLDGGQGVRRVYLGMIGPGSGMKNYYYIKVFMDPLDPNYAITTGLKICAINFNGPYSTQVLAETGGINDGGCAPILLSVELTSFNGVNLGDENKISWETESEVNNSHFVLEHSTDGVVYNSIAMIEGNGASSVSTEYDYMHRGVNALNYYRLKQYDFDGNVDLSKVIVIKSEFSGLKVYPNPASQGEYVIVHSDNRISSIDVRTADGKLLQKQDNLNSSSVTIQELHESGIYFVTVYQFNQSKTIKLIVK